jgi:hypothetical protein
VLILSAKYGLIAASQEIPDYDYRLTAAVARAIRPAVLQGLREALDRTTYLEVGFCLGHNYQRAIEGYKDVIPERTTVTFIRGGLPPTRS